MKKGDVVNYSGKLSEGKPRKNCTIEKIEEAGVMFNQDMATLVGIDHWVSMKELTPCSDDVEEYESEVFIYDDGDGKSRSLVIIGSNGMYSLEAKNYFGKLTEERKKKMKSIGVFSVYD